jgi:hypothetical protein
VRTYSLDKSLDRHPDVDARRLSVVDLRESFGLRRGTQSTKGLFIRMGPFEADPDGFRFENEFELTAAHAVEFTRMLRDEVFVQPIIPGISSRYTEVLTDLSFDLTPFIPGGEVGLPDFVIGQVGLRVKAELAAQLVDLLAKPFGSAAHCGGMAFAGYDLYQQGWPTDNLGTTPPTEGDVGEYIFERLIDSLELNLRKFLRWTAELHLLPKLNGVADVAFGAAVGGIAGPLGIVVAAWLATQSGVFHLGGPGNLLDWTKDEWASLKSHLDREAAWPIGLIYGDTAIPWEQHQVLAIGYEDNGSGKVKLRIWNNNEERKDNILRIDFTGDRLEVKDFKESHTIRGIFAEEYRRNKPPSALFRP